MNNNVTVISRPTCLDSACTTKVEAVLGEYEQVEDYAVLGVLEPGQTHTSLHLLLILPVLLIPYFVRVTNNGDGTISVRYPFYVAFFTALGGRSAALEPEAITVTERRIATLSA